MSSVTAKADRIIKYLEGLIKMRDIKDRSHIHLFLDESDFTKNHYEYATLFEAGQFEKAFALPKSPTTSAVEILRWCWRMGIRVNIYTTRVDTVRVKKSCDDIMEKLNVPGLFNAYICLRTDQNKVVSDFSQVINETILPKEPIHHGVIYCSYLLRASDFENTAPPEYFASRHAVMIP